MEQAKKYLKFDFESLISVYRFTQTVEAVLSKVEYPLLRVSIFKDAKDNYGKHWRGFRAEIKGKQGGRLYIHFGLVYLPETRRGIYLELDKRNNGEIYDSVWVNIKEARAYELNKEEADYLKFFFPEVGIEDLMSGDRESQNKQVENFFIGCIENMLEAAAK